MNKTQTILLAIIALAAGLRLSDLGRNCLWSDEGYTAYLTAKPIETYAEELKGDTAPPLFFYVTRPLARLFPQNEFALRLPAALLGVLAVWLIFTLGLEATGRPVAGIVAAALLACNQLHVVRSQEARSYTLYLAVAIVAMIAMLRMARLAIQRRPAVFRWLWPAVFALALAGMLYTHNVAAFFVAGLLVAPMLAAHGSTREPMAPRLNNAVRAVILVVTIAAVVSILYWPWLDVLRAQLSAVGHGYWIERPTAEFVRAQLRNMLFAPQYPPDDAGLLLPRWRGRQAGEIFAGTAWLAAVLGWVVWWIRREDRRPVALLVGLAIGLVGLVAYSAARTPVFLDKSAIPFIVVPLLGIGLLADALWRACRAKWGGRSVVILLLISAALVEIVNHGSNVHEQWREATRWALATAEPAAGEMILFDDPHNMMAAEWYLAGSPYWPVNWTSVTPHLLAPGGCMVLERRHGPLSQLPHEPVTAALQDHWRAGQRLWVIQRTCAETLCQPVEQFLHSAGQEVSRTEFHGVRVRMFVRNE